MSSPTIPDLPVASVANDADQMLIRQPAGALGTDKNVLVSLVRKINVSGLPTLTSPTTAQDSDLFLISRGGVNFQIRHDQVSFRSGTKMWFYHNAFTEIGGWSLVSAGDNLLAVKGGSTYSVGGVELGTWQQEGVGGGSPGGGLSIAQMPSHDHDISGAGATAGSGSQVRGWRNPGGSSSSKPWSTLTNGSGSPHNHGSSWRPLASVGIICQKN